MRVSLAIISWTLARTKRSKKSLSYRATERNQELQTLWELEVVELNNLDLLGRVVWVHGPLSKIVVLWVGMDVETLRCSNIN